MSRFRKVRDKRDANHGKIVAFLRGHGIQVTECERPVDLHVYNGKGHGWLEIKTGSRNAQILRSQLEFMSETSQPVSLATCESDALRFALYLDGWTQLEKDRIAAFLIVRPKTEKLWYPATIEKALKGQITKGDSVNG